MIKIIAGGKKNTSWAMEACAEYEKRLKKPFDITWSFMPEERLEKYLAEWPFTGRKYVICCDERGENISSPELAERMEKAFSFGGSPCRWCSVSFDL